MTAMVLNERARRCDSEELSSLLEQLEELSRNLEELGLPTTSRRRAAGASFLRGRPRTAAPSETLTEMSMDTWRYITPDSDSFKSLSIPSVTYESASSGEVTAAMAEVDEQLAEMWRFYKLCAASPSQSLAVEEKSSSSSGGSHEASASKRTRSSRQSTREQKDVRRVLKDKETQTSAQVRFVAHESTKKPAPAPGPFRRPPNARCGCRAGANEKRQTRPAPQTRRLVASSQINRERNCKKIEQENEKMRKRLAAVKPVVSCWWLY